MRPQKGGNDITPVGTMSGPWIGTAMPVQAIKTINGGQKVYLIEHGIYTKMVLENGTARYYTGTINEFSPDKWDTYNNAGNNYILNLPATFSQGNASLDKSPQCLQWAQRTPSECTTNPGYMLANCATSCASYIASPVLVPNYPGYKVLKNTDSGGNDLTKLADGSSLEAMAAACNADGRCVAFNDGGWIKHSVNSSLNHDVNWQGKKLNLYVKQQKNPLAFMNLPLRCETYNKLVTTGKPREKVLFKKLYGEECMPLYKSLLNRCKTGQDPELLNKQTGLTSCRDELKTCITKYKIFPRGTIESAWFGPDNGGHVNTVNVRDKLIAMQKAGKVNVVASSRTFGDPAPGVQKFLFVNYLTETDEYKKYKIPENSVFNVTFPHVDVKLGQKGGAISQVPPKQQRQIREGDREEQTREGGEQTQEGGEQTREGEGLQYGGASKKQVPLFDKSPYCSEWATRNPSECVINRSFMKANCAKSYEDYMKSNRKKAVNGGVKVKEDDVDPLDDYTEFAIRKHVNFPNLMKNYTSSDSCPDIKDYVLKSNVIDTHQQALHLITELKKMNSVNERSITLHPQYPALMNKYAYKSSKGYVPCQQCPIPTTYTY